MTAPSPTALSHHKHGKNRSPLPPPPSNTNLVISHSAAREREGGRRWWRGETINRLVEGRKVSETGWQVSRKFAERGASFFPPWGIRWRRLRPAGILVHLILRKSLLPRRVYVSDTRVIHRHRVLTEEKNATTLQRVPARMRPPQLTWRRWVEEVVASHGGALRCWFSIQGENIRRIRSWRRRWLIFIQKLSFWSRWGGKQGEKSGFVSDKLWKE